MSENYRIIRSTEQLCTLFLEDAEEVCRCAFMRADLTAAAEAALRHSYRDCLFVGCKLPMGLKRQSRDCLFIPNMGVSFTFRNQLYSPDELYEGYVEGKPESYARSFDAIVYRHYMKKGKLASDVKETLARALHDQSIHDCMTEFFGGFGALDFVGVMGGHSLKRTDEEYLQTVLLAKTLTENGFVMVTGGGPGAMEATHLGAWMAGRTREELDEAMRILSTAPDFTCREWLDTAMRVRRLFPQSTYQSLGIPTWYYGHEPATPFATHIAKFFANSIREDLLLTIATCGVIYTPGSAGTLQEIFQEAVQNHYMSFGFSSPMIFLGVDFWTKEVPVWQLIQHLVNNGRYKNLRLLLSDEPTEAVQMLVDFRKAGNELMRGKQA
ncbi:MAG: hypothetical protein HUK03_08665 [Bacteroidaceae bacterium]|nr:hypothetical protein [Bacteroidaceae bacterium]